MALQQTSIGQYFASRKRQATDPLGDAKLLAGRKVLILDENAAACHVSSDSPEIGRKILAARPPSLSRKTPVSRRGSASKTTPKSTAKKSLFPPIEKNEPSSVRTQDIKTLFGQAPASSVVPSEMKYPASPMKKKRDNVSNRTTQKTEEKPALEGHQTGGVTTSEKECKDELPAHQVQSKKQEETPAQEDHGPATAGKGTVGTLRKELGLSEIKAKLMRSSRLGEIREALGRLKQGHDKVLNPPPTTPTKSPSLKQFKSIQLEVPTSPSKALFDNIKDLRSPNKVRDTVFMSPVKLRMMGLSPVKSPPSQSYTSPRKLLDELGSAAAKSPPPAYQRYFGLVASGKSGLILPYKYRTLAELFRSVDTASSMMFTRKEVVTFAKLKQPVIELCKRNLTEAHLGQIQTVLPDAFKFSQEKVHQFGQTDKYQLVVTPTIAGDSKEHNNKTNCELLTPSVLLERKRRFYQALVERVKDHHEVLLKSLDPPMIVPRDKLTRWHPEFDVESCPDIEPSPLPQPPNIEKLSTARDVLNKAREMFTVNPRMEKALQKLSENSNSASQPATSAAAVIPSLASALKGIPKSLLEKVRARQAAKALELLTQGQEQSKECVRLRRLPELARILRNLYVTEKKSVLLMDAVITKMCSCYREILSPADMEHHIQIMIDKVPEWLTLNSGGRYLRMAKDMELSIVMKILEEELVKNSI